MLWYILNFFTFVMYILYHLICLSLYLFTIVIINEIIKNIQNEAQRYLMFANNVFIIVENMEEVNSRLKE